MTILRIRRAPRDPAAVATTGLQFLSNGVTGSDIRLNWVGANLLSRTAHTAIWKANYTQQAGYYALIWSTDNQASWVPQTYQYGTHPFPCDGTFDAGGLASNGTSNAGTDHYHEIAGLPFWDYIATAGGTALQLVTGSWLTQARKCEVVGSILRHTSYPDLVGNSSYSIVQDINLSDLSTPTTAAFVIGCSPWTSSNWAGSGSGYTNSETPSCTLRGIQLYSAGLSLAQIQARMDLAADASVVSNDPGSLWYSNINPTPSDVTDKSGSGHTPAWANANRPTLWSG